MRFIAMIKGDKDYEAGNPPDPKLMEAMGKYTEEMMKAGVVLSAEGLRPSAQGARVTLSGGKLTITDGPFAEAKELIGGYAILKVKSKAEAIAHASSFLKLHEEVLGAKWSGECELRQLEDF